MLNSRLLRDPPVSLVRLAWKCPLLVVDFLSIGMGNTTLESSQRTALLCEREGGAWLGIRKPGQGIVSYSHHGKLYIVLKN